MQDNQSQTLNYQLYLLDRNFKSKSRLNEYIKQCQDFYNGDQYPNENYKNMIRCTMNICSFSSNIKASKINGTPIYITFTSDNGMDTTPLQRFDEYNRSKLHEETENLQSALNGLNNGTEILFIRWDEDDTSYQGIYKGGLVYEHIDPRNFAVANPELDNLQNQKWLMFWKDEEMASVRSLLEGSEEEIEEKKHLLMDEIASGDNTYYENNNTNVNHALVTMYTRYFKVDGEVYFMCSTKNVDIFEYPHAMNPEVNRDKIKKIVDDYRKSLEKTSSDDETFNDNKVADYKIDYEDMVMQYINKTKKFGDKEYKKIKEKFSLYPFASFVPFVQTGSFYGRSDIKSLISIQKYINFAISMMGMCIQNNAYNKIFVKDGALQGQKITNEPGQVIVDYSRRSNDWGIKMAESQPMPNGLTDFNNQVFGMARTVYGFSDVMDGSITNQDISGYAVQLMSKQANSTIEQQQKIFWDFCKDKAAIRLMFYKFFVDKAKYTYELEDYEVQRLEQDRTKLLRMQNAMMQKGQSLEVLKNDDGTLNNDVYENLNIPTRKTQIREFSKGEIYGHNFDISYDATQGTMDSKLQESQFWDNMLLNGGISNLTPDQLDLYIQANPTISQKTRDALKNVIEKQKREENTQLRNALNEAMQKLQQAGEIITQLKGQNDYQKKYTDNLTKEFTNKINAANQYIQSRQNPITESEQKSRNATAKEVAEA